MHPPLLLLVVLSMCFSSPAATAAASKPPHVLFVLADDLGWGNVGWHRETPTPEVKTPKLDQLVKDGIEMNRMYTWHACSPTRSSLQTGRLPIHVNAHNANPEIYNASSASGTGAGIPRNMTGMAAKLAAAGYNTVFVGKWDAGMATPHHTPAGRGYKSALCYFHHANDYWSQHDPAGGKGAPCAEKIGVDLYDTTQPAWGLNTSIVHHNYRDNQAYEEVTFHTRLSKELAAHDATTPLFMFYSAHLVHLPYQVPQDYLDAMSKAGGGPIDNSTSEDDSMRMIYHAMVHYLDDAVGALVEEWKAKGMWNTTLMWFCSDNGGPIYAGGNNYPMRGGKYSEFEGGVRVSSFLSGGLVHPAKRGLRSEALAHVADVYVTLCSLAQVSAVDEWAITSRLPPVDGFDLSAVFLSPNPATVSASPRQVVPLAPLTGGDLENLEEYERLLAAWNARQQQQQRREVTAVSHDPATVQWDVHMNATCGADTGSKIKPNGHLVNVTLAECEEQCGANQLCKMLQYANHDRWCGLHNATSAPIPSKQDDKFDCVCKGPCPARPGPSPSPPGPKPPKVPMCYRSLKCTVDPTSGFEPFAVKKKQTESECCSACATLVNSTHGGPVCALAVLLPDPQSPDKSGSCALYTKYALGAKGNNPNKTVCFQPSADNPPPEPVIMGQAGIVVGDMKLVTGVQVNMAIFTGPHYPNASTPHDLIDGKVPTFGCSTPAKPWGCLFNLSSDPTEHNDLAAAQPAVAKALLHTLRNVSRTYFDPERGDVDPAACARMMGPNHGFFGPWLEMEMDIPAAAQADGENSNTVLATAELTQRVPPTPTMTLQEDSGVNYRLEIELGMLEKARKEWACKKQTNELSQ